MALFQPNVREVRPIVTQHKGVQDDTASRVLAAGYEVGRGAYAGYQQAKLVGEEGHVSSVSPTQDYGSVVSAPQEGMVGPVAELNRELDLTRIASARKQGSISAERAKALVNIRLRESINNNPMLADDLRRRAEAFLGDMGTGGTGSNSLFTPSAQEEEDAFIRRQELKANVDFANRARLSGYTPQQLLEIEYEASESARAQREIEDTARLDSMNERTLRPKFSQVINGSALAINGAMVSFAEQRAGGLLQPNDIVQLSTMIRAKASEIRRGIEMHREHIGDNTDKYLNRIDNWQEQQIALVSEPDYAKFATKMRTQVQDVAMANALQNDPQAYAIRQLYGDAGSELLLRVRSNPELANVLSAIDQNFHGIQSLGNMDSLATLGEGSSIYLNTLRAISGQPPSTATGGPVTSRDVPDPAAVTVVAQAIVRDVLGFSAAEPESVQKLKEESEQYLIRESANDLRSLAPYVSDYSVRQRAMSNPKIQEQLSEAVARYADNLIIEASKGQFDPTLFNVSVRDAEEVRNAAVLSGSSYVPSVAIPGGGSNPSTFSFDSGVSVKVNEQAILPDISSSLMGDSDTRVVDARRQASQIRMMYGIANTYPNLKFEGKPLREWLDTNLMSAKFKIAAEPAPEPAPEKNDVVSVYQRGVKEGWDRDKLFNELVDAGADREELAKSWGYSPTVAEEGITEEEMAAEPPRPISSITEEEASKIKAAPTIRAKIAIIEQLGFESNEDVESILNQFQSLR